MPTKDEIKQAVTQFQKELNSPQFAAAVQGHTFGPWKMEERHPALNLRYWEITTPSGQRIVSSQGFASGDASYEPSLGDGRLIAAAPDLLAALMGMIEGHGPTCGLGEGPCIVAAKAAIEKAVGQ